MGPTRQPSSSSSLPLFGIYTNTSCAPASHLRRRPLPALTHARRRTRLRQRRLRARLLVAVAGTATAAARDPDRRALLERAERVALDAAAVPVLLLEQVSDQGAGGGGPRSSSASAQTTSSASVEASVRHGVAAESRPVLPALQHHVHLWH